jgi:PST family polysaccharide transporter
MSRPQADDAFPPAVETPPADVAVPDDPTVIDDQLEAQPVEESRAALGGRAARGAIQTLSAQLIKIAIQLGGVVVLARLLTPSDYGLVAMVTAIVGVAEIFRDFGLSAAAVQAKRLTRRQRDNLFWINTAAGLVLTMMVMVCAPLIALWYGRPELVDLARAISLVFLFNGMTTQYRADLNRHLRFASIAAIDVTAPIVALGIAIVFAVLGAGPWALVAQQLATSVVLLIGAVSFARWLPRLPHRSEPMGDLITFGWHLAGSQFVGYLGNNVDSLVIGTRFGATSLGLYNRAFQLLMTPLGQLRQPTTTVALPVLSRLRPDPDATNRYVERGQMALGLTLVAGLGLVIGAAEPITSIFLGSQWLQVEPILRLLAVAGAFQTLAYVGYWVYLSHGLTKQLLHYTFITVTIKITCILVGSLWGVLGVATGYAVAPAIAWPLSFWWLSRSSNIRVRPLFVGAGRILLLAAVIAAASWLACDASAQLGRWWQFLIGCAAALLGYAVVMLVPIFRRDLRGLLDIADRGLHRVQGRKTT